MKVRDIQKSHQFREAVSKWGEPNRRKRIFIATQPDELANSDTRTNIHHSKSDELPVAEAVTDRLYTVDQHIQHKQSEYNNLKSWIDERKLLRKQMKNLGLTTTWLENKTPRTECEENVYNRMANTKRDEKEKCKDFMPRNFSRKPRLSAAHVDMLPFLNSPLPVALAIIADYLSDNRLRLIDLFKKGDKNKDWNMTRDELKKSLRGTRIPLTDAQLDELIITIDSNNDDQLSYKELARGIDAYHKDRRWQKLKSMYDNIIDNDVGDKLRTRRTSVTERKAVVDLLLLPKFERNDNNGAATKDKRVNKNQERRERARTETKRGLKSFHVPSFTTLTGEMGKRKIKYLDAISEESDTCYKRLQSEGIFAHTNCFSKVLVPPTENTTKTCKLYLTSELSLFPRQHSLNKEYEKQRKRKIRKSQTAVTFTSNRETESEVPRDKYESSTLPRVASLSRQRDKEGRRRRYQIGSASPTLCWPQHLLDKLRLCMDDTTVSNGKSVMFNCVKYLK